MSFNQFKTHHHKNNTENVEFKPLHYKNGEEAKVGDFFRDDDAFESNMTGMHAVPFKFIISAIHSDGTVDLLVNGYLHQVQSRTYFEENSTLLERNKQPINPSAGLDDFDDDEEDYDDMD